MKIELPIITDNFFFVKNQFLRKIDDEGSIYRAGGSALTNFYAAIRLLTIPFSQFLDVTITVEKKHLTYIYRRPTHIDTIISNNCNHLRKPKLAVLHNNHHRATITLTDKKDLNNDKKNENLRPCNPELSTLIRK